MEKVSVTYKRKKYYVEEQSLDLSALNITDIDEIKGLESLTDLQELYLCENLITEIKGLDNLTSLEELDLNSNKIQEIKGLDNLTNLRALYFTKNQISELKGLDNLTNLQELYLNHNRIEEIKDLDTLTSLEVLNLSKNQVKVIEGLEHLSSLRAIDLSKNPIRRKEKHLIEIGKRDAQKVVRYCHLRKTNEFMTFRGKSLEIIDDGLTLLGYKITDINEIKGLEVLTNLKWLNLSHNQISDMKRVEELINLEYLDLEGNQISEIEGLENLVKLKELRLARNRITGIRGLENLTNLKKLCLGHNRITELKGLENLTKLDELWLDENPIRKDEWHRAFQRVWDGEWQEEYVLTWDNAQYIVNYCRRKKNGEIPQVTVRGETYYAYYYRALLYLGKDGEFDPIDLAEFFIDDNDATSYYAKKYYDYDESGLRLDLNSLAIADIKEIEGLETLSNLKILNLRNNLITEIKDLESLSNLKILDLRDNPIKTEERHLLGESTGDRNILL